MKGHLKILFVFLLGLIVGQISAATPPSNIKDPRTPKIWGTIYKMGSNRKEVLYTNRQYETLSDGILTTEVDFYDPKGNLVFQEEMHSENGKVKYYSEKVLQTGASGHLETKDGKINFHYQTPSGKDNDSEKLKSSFVVGLSLMDYIKAHWKKLMAGDEVEIRFGVLDRKETVGFELFRVKKKEKKEGEIVIKMKPSTFIIAALVDPVYFYIDAESKKLNSYIGRVKPKQKKGSQWKDLDAEVVYVHNKNM